MTRKTINPDTLFDPSGFAYSQGAVTDGAHTLHIAGQAALDVNVQVVGSDIAAQARATLDNIRVLLSHEGLSASHLVRLRIYIVDLDEEKLQAVVSELHAFYGDAEPAPNTVVGVSALALDGMMVEIDATAIY